MKRRYTVEKMPPKSGFNHHIFRIYDTKTGFHAHFYAEEFLYGQMHYNERTAQLPNYVHDEVWRMAG